MKSIPKQILFFVLILLISILANQFLIDTKYYSFFSNSLKNVIEILLVIITGVIGSEAWKLEDNKWRFLLWKSVYIVIVIFFILAALIDKFIFSYSGQNRFRFFSIKEFFYGPIPYLVFILLGKIILPKKIF